jgi:hypothetical protein
MIFQKILNSFESFDFDAEIGRAFVKLEDEIITLNQNQLNIFGTDSDGERLQTYKAKGSNAYADFTIQLKKEAGKEYDHVTLNDSGAFYETMQIAKNGDDPILKGDEFQIVADFRKGNESIGKNIDISNVLGLTDENKIVVSKSMKTIIDNEIKQFISQLPKP